MNQAIELIERAIHILGRHKSSLAAVAYDAIHSNLEQALSLLDGEKCGTHSGVELTEIKVQLLKPTLREPFRKVECNIVDIGYSDKTLVVEERRQ
jgi:hypothetical protein